MDPQSTLRQGRGVLRPLAAAALLLAAAFLAGLAWFAATLPRQPADLPAETTDAVVVVTGGSGRIAAGLRLLEEKRAGKLFVSGVDRTAGMAELLKYTPRPEGLPEDLQCCVALGYLAGDTVGNAAETAAWMRDQGFRSLRLVTANYHMRRAVLEFRMAMPDLTILTYPVDPNGFPASSWWQSSGALGLVFNEYAKYLVTAAKYLAFEARRAIAGTAA
jgi:uncharacterized SAM-binding protein YcdF (DUF218 family)